VGECEWAWVGGCECEQECESQREGLECEWQRDEQQPRERVVCNAGRYPPARGQHKHPTEQVNTPTHQTTAENESRKIEKFTPFLARRVVAGGCIRVAHHNSIVRVLIAVERDSRAPLDLCPKIGQS
jgi:hypothetical protein